MMDRNYDNTGRLFARQKRTPNSPDVGGDIEFGQDLIEYLNDCLSKGKPAKLELSGWMKLDRKRQSFTSLKVSVPYQERENAQTGQPRGYPNRGNYPTPAGGYPTPAGGYPTPAGGHPPQRQGMPDRNVSQGYDRGGYADRGNQRSFDMGQERQQSNFRPGGPGNPYGQTGGQRDGDLDDDAIPF